METRFLNTKRFFFSLHKRLSLSWQCIITLLAWTQSNHSVPGWELSDYVQNICGQETSIFSFQKVSKINPGVIKSDDMIAQASEIPSLVKWMTFGQEGVIYGGGGETRHLVLVYSWEASRFITHRPEYIHVYVHFNTVKRSENQGEIKRHMVDLGIKINIAD